ncbi:B-cell lymphoma 3 protein-like [Patagioenas fasciata]|uniref:B-cell lymphoma 3 protein-like n=1 Tax=Patagioenas fasciata TaxID=372321 RepID=UPI003A99E2FC
MGRSRGGSPPPPRGVAAAPEAPLGDPGGGGDGGDPHPSPHPSPPPRAKRREPPLPLPPPPPHPPGLGFAAQPPPGAFFTALQGALPLLGGGGALGAPPGVLALPAPPPLGPPAPPLAAAIAAATRADEDGDTALHIAVAQGALGVARRLVGLFLQGGRDLDVYNRMRQTPLHLAVITSQPALVRLLVSHGASPSAPDRLGRSAAHLACEAASPRCLRELLRGGRGLDLQARNYEGLTPLHVAVGSGAPESVRLLLDHGADVDAVDIKSGRSPLLHAVERNSLEMAELLIQRGARVNAQCYAGCTALHAAAGRALPGLLRLLLRNGADTGVRNGHNETPLALAGSAQVIDILRGKAARPPPSPPRGPQNGRASPGPPPATNQRAASAQPPNGARGVKHEGPAPAPPLAESPPLHPMASPGREASANQEPPRAARTDQSPPEPPRLRPREARGQAGGAR